MIKLEIPLLGHIPERIFTNATKRLEGLRSAHADYTNEELLMLLLCEDAVRAERNQELLEDSYRDHLKDLEYMKHYYDGGTNLFEHKIKQVKQKGV